MKKEGIKAIVFDIGGVLIKESGSESRKLCLKKLDLYSNELSEKFKIFTLNNLEKSLSGKINYPVFFKKFIIENNLSKKPSDFANAWLWARRKTSRINKPLLKIAKNLKKDYVLVAFTNATRLNDKIRNEIGIYSYFNLKLISFKLGVIKPELKAYKILASKLKNKDISRKESVIIDNNQKNIDIAKKLGLKAICFKDNNQLIKDLRKLGVKL